MPSGPDLVDPHQLGDHLFEIRRRCGLTQKAAAATAGLRSAQLSHIECGRATPKLETLFRLARTYGLTPACLLAGLGPEGEDLELQTWGGLCRPDREALRQLHASLHRLASLTILLELPAPKV